MDANRLQMPSELRRLLGDGEWLADTMGCSDSQVFHVGHGYLKIVPRVSLMNLRAEKDRMLWLQGRLPVPEVYYYGVDEQNEYLYMSEIPGVMACDPVFRNDMPELIALLAEALRMMHAVDIAQCPFDQSLSYRLALAYQGVQQGRVAEEAITARYPDLIPATLYEHLTRVRPTEEDLVFTHGDFCLPNILLDRERHRVSGFIDLEYAGMADRYRDFERVCWSLGFNFSREWIPALLKAYGLEEEDQKKMMFYAQLEDLLWASELP
ncbi:aminoglycoside 3'-phosphotransferase [Reticulibacter mediterranei]|uniref:Aminoglycoside 3'-phosphotransferase n=1 Tax=Reticulibacter mediterranei TaxID=2778369 RepID=A0A8J3N121_9CHLR|nr:APH(3') family aminoglycoside O-phosphotransferase [Reticulibacter mediterranei]GHO94764.1 aminoglycoside 3'-phosphotransferase [Reticulibacter mediterranei]